MILQRLASAVRRQDWFQVMIEVMIVIIGIFLGLQVQAWYEDQAKAEEEYLLLTALAEDYRSNIAMIDTLITYAGEKIVSENEIMGRSAGEPTNDLNIDQLLADTSWYMPATFSQSAAESFLLGGDQNLISNRLIRDAVVRLPHDIERLRNFVDNEEIFTRDHIIVYLQENAYVNQISNNDRGNPGMRDYKYEVIYPLSDKLIMDHNLLLQDGRFIGIINQDIALLRDISQLFPLFKNEFAKTLQLIEEEL